MTASGRTHPLESTDNDFDPENVFKSRDDKPSGLNYFEEDDGDIEAEVLKQYLGVSPSGRTERTEMIREEDFLEVASEADEATGENVQTGDGGTQLASQTQMIEEEKPASATIAEDETPFDSQGPTQVLATTPIQGAPKKVFSANVTTPLAPSSTVASRGSARRLGVSPRIVGSDVEEIAEKKRSSVKKKYKDEGADAFAFPADANDAAESGPLATPVQKSAGKKAKVASTPQSEEWLLSKHRSRRGVASSTAASADVESSEIKSIVDSRSMTVSQLFSSVWKKLKSMGLEVLQWIRTSRMVLPHARCQAQKCNAQCEYVCIPRGGTNLRTEKLQRYRDGSGRSYR